MPLTTVEVDGYEVELEATDDGVEIVSENPMLVAEARDAFNEAIGNGYDDLTVVESKRIPPNLGHPERVKLELSYEGDARNLFAGNRLGQLYEDGWIVTSVAKGHDGTACVWLTTIDRFEDA